MGVLLRPWCVVSNLFYQWGSPWHGSLAVMTAAFNDQPAGIPLRIGSRSGSQAPLHPGQRNWPPESSATARGNTCQCLVASSSAATLPFRFPVYDLPTHTHTHKKGRNVMLRLASELTPGTKHARLHYYADIHSPKHQKKSWIWPTNPSIYLINRPSKFFATEIICEQ